MSTHFPHIVLHTFPLGSEENLFYNQKLILLDFSSTFMFDYIR